MVQKQIKARGIGDEKVLAAFLQVPRHLFVDPNVANEAYHDHPLGIGLGQTISQPYIVALMTAALQLNKHDRVLEIGTGSGYQTAILSCLVKKVYSIERLSPLIKEAQARLTNLGYHNIVFACQDGNDGWESEAPFDAITIAAATAKIPPKLLNQLKIGGRMILPLGSPFFQRLTLLHKKEDGYDINHLCGCSFVPLISENQ
ncbi:MAG TPA: protein-L-isoaspartate(D-aspartate) O-methyltransferase [Bacilli bacterium]|nr:protein-L-isoaspartate(D-aspartate) O-methyltransferase [Bacilli bacterium]